MEHGVKCRLSVWIELWAQEGMKYGRTVSLFRGKQEARRPGKRGGVGDTNKHRERGSGGRNVTQEKLIMGKWKM